MKKPLRFEVNSQAYLLSFNSENHRWYLLTPSITGGVQAIPVIDDDGLAANIVIPIGDMGVASMN